ncbi:type II toxin-antitoxin system RelB/DinJ family antitoxin [Candidatus Daviesbacteria bacterium]|nr:type II toxin-antitoxin system RelB/DinJ family antitoxin [Candidatus Daviesbacteria bacterium]
MNTSVVNVKIDPQTKKKAQDVAEQLGFSLSSLINAYLKQLIRTKTVNFSALEENPSEYMLNSLKEAEEEIKRGEISPAFDNADEAIAWLNKNEDQVR